jgi:hypothetical protein
MFRWVFGIVVMVVVFGAPPWMHHARLTPTLSGRLLVDSVPRRGVLIAVASANDSACHAPWATTRTVARGKFDLPAQRAWRAVPPPILGRDYRLSRWRVCADIGGVLRPAFDGVVSQRFSEAPRAEQLECAAFTASPAVRCHLTYDESGHVRWRR